MSSTEAGVAIMPMRLDPRWGGYVRTKDLPTKIVCKGYTAPPSQSGAYVGSVRPGTTLGPIAAVEHSEDFVSLKANGWWINIWCARRGGVDFAFVVLDYELKAWAKNGWQHIHQ